MHCVHTQLFETNCLTCRKTNSPVQFIAGLRVKADHRTATTQGSPDTALMVKAQSIWRPALLVHPHTLHYPAMQHLLFFLGSSIQLLIEPKTHVAQFPAGEMHH